MTHAASHQAWHATVNALFGKLKSFKVDYSVIPWATFTDPEIARVGLNEQEAKERGLPYDVTSYGIDDLDRAITEGEDHGIVKVLTVPGKDRILGVTIIGHNAGELITEYISAMKYDFGMNKIGISKADQKQRTEQEKKLIYKYEKEAQNLEATEEALIQRLQMLQDEENNAF